MMQNSVEKSSISVQDLVIHYHKKSVLWNINLNLPQDQLIAIAGPNGAGKSTLLKSIMGIIPITHGKVMFWNKDLVEVRKKVSYIPQKESVDWNFPISVWDVVMMGRYADLGLFGKPKSHDYDIVAEALKKLKIHFLAKKQIGELSGGQQQRVFLARALAQQAKIYIMDEPFTGIDETTQNDILTLLNEMKQNNITIVVVHHDLEDISQYFNWLVLLNVRLIASGPIKEVFKKEYLKAAYGPKLQIFSQITNM